MTTVDRLTRWCLARAARRWPAELREEMHTEWLAELTALETDRGTAWRRLAYAFSLLAAPPIRDETGAPRGWCESLALGAPIAGLLVAALMTLAVSESAPDLARRLGGLVGVGDFSPGVEWLSALGGAVITLAWCLLAGHWLSRRWPLPRTGRFGDAGPAALAPFAFAPMILLVVLSGEGTPGAGPLGLLGLVGGVLIWAIGTSVLGVAAVRATRRGRAAALILLGVPLMSGLGAVGPVLPSALGGRNGPTTGEAISLSWGLSLACFATFVLTYGFGALRPRQQTRPASLVAQDGDRERWPAAVVVAGTGAIAVAVIGWAYTVAVLTPAISTMSSSGPLVGQNGALAMWTGELRAAAILLATLGLLIATADRRFGPAATLVVFAGLTLASSLLNRTTVTGPGDLRLALLIGVVPVIAGRLIAGRTMPDRLPEAARRHTMVGVLVAAGALPLITMQGIPGVNYSSVPIGLAVTTIGLAVAGILLAVVPTLALSRHPVPVVVAVALVVALVALTVGTALAPRPASDDLGYGDFAAFVTLPLAVVCLALLRRHRARRPGRTVAVWTALTVAALPGIYLTVLGGMFLAVFVPPFLFEIGTSDYPDQGWSVVPGAATLILPVAALAAARLDGAGGQGRRCAPEPDPIPQPSPQPAENSV